MPVGPFDLEGPVEAFDFPVLPWAVGADRQMFGVDGGENLGDGAAFGVAPMVVGHHGFDAGDPVRSEKVGGSCQEPGAGVSTFVGMDLGVSEPGVVIDG